MYDSFPIPFPPGHENPSLRVAYAISTYPRVLVVPTSVTTTELRYDHTFHFAWLNSSSAMRDRTRQRIPVLSWAHPHCSAVLCRSSQPAMGLTSRQLNDDAVIVRKILGMILEKFGTPISCLCG